MQEEIEITGFGICIAMLMESSKRREHRLDTESSPGSDEILRTTAKTVGNCTDL